ncbi:DUF2931 family protein [Gynuella sunshinyii]|uniref:DUF2931 family protein n=1 Tax=Gynuella sunshinyii YC6258 TaxID=1445510 RepID=A0A0C5VF43_9GAMM|nr:DUF2931 family protein [Gynuella sunshinyii]AJQ93172.1 hypothetical Protein YC6258_01124 [Gynuella sunshinyii YC6258]
MFHRFKEMLLILSSILLLMGCQEKTYDYGFSEGGIGGEGWPVWGEYLIVNEAWQVPVGNLSGGYPDNIPDTSQSVLGEKPIPHMLRARWFSYRNQTFYEVTVSVTKDRQAQVKNWFRRYPRPEYLHTLSVGFSGQGELQAWWTVVCVRKACDEDVPGSDHFELTPRTTAVVAEGDPNQYYNTTRELIGEGSIPASVLDLVPVMENPPDEHQYDDILDIVPKE